jgi:hypothetical protein
MSFDARVMEWQTKILYKKSAGLVTCCMVVVVNIMVGSNPICKLTTPSMQFKMNVHIEPP